MQTRSRFRTAGSSALPYKQELQVASIVQRRNAAGPIPKSLI